MYYIKKLLCNHKIFIVLSVLLISIVLYFIPEYRSNINIYSFSFYQLNYEYGFISRGFIGTIFKLIFGKVLYENIYFLTCILVMLLCTLIAFIFESLIKKYSNNKKIYLIVLLFIFCPSSFLMMLIATEFGRFDYFLFFNAILSIILIYKNKWLYLIPIISFISMLIHQNYLFYFFPLISMLLLYNYFEKENKENIKILILNIVSVLIAFILIYTIGKDIPFVTAEEFRTILISNTNYYVDFDPINFEFFTSFKDSFNMTINSAGKNQSLIDYIYAIVAVTVYYVYLWNICLKHKYKNTKYKKLFILLILSTFGALVLCLIGTDYGRWYTAIINSMNILCIYLLFDNFKIFNKYLKNINKKYIIFMIIMLICFVLMFETTGFYYLEFTKLHTIKNYLFTLIM